MRVLTTLLILCALSVSPTASAQTTPSEPSPAQAPAEPPRSGFLFVPVFSSNPKLGTAGGALVGFMHVFDPGSRVSIFGVMYQYTSTHSQIGTVFARTSFGADHHRLVAIAAAGYIKNDYGDYLGTGQPLKTNDDLRAAAVRYLYRVWGNWFIGAQGTAANYQVLGATDEDELVLETLGVRGFKSAAVGAVVMHDSRDNEDMPTGGWFMNLNNLAYREALGGSAAFDAYRADFRAFLPHGGGHVLALRQYNWLTSDAPTAAQGTVILRGYKFGQYLAPYMSSFEAEERLKFSARWGATIFAGAARLYGEPPLPLERHTYPTAGAGLHFVLKPAQRIIVNLEYAHGVQDNQGVYLKLGYAW
jgi:hypothetical protein